MDDAVGVGVLQGGAHLAGDGEDIVQSFRAAVVERLTFHQLGHDKGP